MAVSIISILKEEARQGLTGDSNYNKSMPWVFRIVVEGESFKGPTGFDGTALFPLPIAPDRFEYTLPFALEATPQQEGGVVTEEGGIVIGDISISATTGWKLRKVDALVRAPAMPVFTSQIANQGASFQKEVSGQFAFWILANYCFEGYSELKKDPELASKTRLELHIMKEQLHLEVVPVTFRLSRDASRNRVTYNYDIQLRVIGEAKPIDYEAPSEKSIFSAMKDSFSKIRSAVQSISALLDDINASVGELTRFASSIPGIINDLGSIIDSATNLIDGVKGFLDIPAQFIQATSNLVASTAALFEDFLNFPADVAQAFLEIGDELDKLQVAARDHYKQSWESVSDSYNKRSDTNTTSPENISSHQQILIDRAKDDADAAHGTMTVDQAFGSPLKPGDQARQDFPKAGDRMNKREYSGFEERVVGQGDTLQSLAAKYFLDPNKWVDLAVVNGLRPPYITGGAKMAGTLQVGGKIMIPISRPTAAHKVLTAGDVPFGQSQSEVHMGTDHELVKLPNGQYGWAVDVAHGSTDARPVCGINNLAQAIHTRLWTTMGENILFPRVGLPRLVGSKQIQDTRSEANLRVRQQLLADPRIEKLIKCTFTLVKDALTIEATVQPVGFNTSRVISRTLA